PTTEQTAQLLGLATRISKPRPEEMRQVRVENLGEETALFLNRTLRSGTRVEFSGHVIVLGDVNPGAEIVAEGNVLVWGKLRGAVHAGSNGDTTAVVCALDLSPTRLQIAGETTMPSLDSQRTLNPETARINEHGKLQSETWSPDR
ncbi:MAG TPA: septum site-determining protein MinC, partial [Anaerolineales bacterium]|nr:septum site-determining protein MinC [Anaerolineales bacterium]